MSAPLTRAATGRRVVAALGLVLGIVACGDPGGAAGAKGPPADDRELGGAEAAPVASRPNDSPGLAVRRSAMSEPAPLPPDNAPTLALPRPGRIVLPADPPRLSPHKRVELREVVVPALATHAITSPSQFGHGQGVALLDFDGDADLDLFVGGFDPSTGGPPGARPCVYRNVSEPGAIAFERVDDWCLDGHVTGASAIDLEGDGVHELIALTTEGLRIVGSDGRDTELGRFSDATAPCFALSAIPFDVDHDGDLDIVAGCRRLQGVHTGNTVWLRVGDAFEPLGTSASSAFVSTGFSAMLGVGAIDLDRDGLLDLIEVQDSFSTEGQRNMTWAHGGARLWCAPDDVCSTRLVPFAGGLARWGSFMGLGVIRLADGHEGVLLSDWGPVRLLALRDDASGFDGLDPVGRGFPDGTSPDPTAFRFGFPDGEFPRFSWGVVVDDFDADGYDDALVTEGPIHRVGPAEAHRSFLALQDPDGAFEVVIEGAGLPATLPYERRTTRAALKADLDLDGRLDLVFAVELGPVRILTTARPTRATRCTVAPQTSLVPAWGYGFEVFTKHTGWTRWDVQGQNQSAAPPWVLAPDTRGTIRFPSGFEAPFDCGTAHGPVLVREPDWLTLTPVDRGSALRASVPITGAVAEREDGSRVTLSGEALGADELRPPSDARRVMLQVDGAWVGRWLELPP